MDVEKKIKELLAMVDKLNDNDARLANNDIKLSNAISHEDNAIKNLNDAVLTALHTQNKILNIIGELKARILKLESDFDVKSLLKDEKEKVDKPQSKDRRSYIT